MKIGSVRARPGSNLRQHTQRKHSPAFGHQARRNSAASMLPERVDSLSREAHLAEQISSKRRLRQSKGGAKESTDTKQCRQSEPTGKESKRRRLFTSHHPRRLRSDSASAYPFLHELDAEASNSHNELKQKDTFKVMRGLRLQNVSDDGHRWSFEPFLRSENHPVFVQPIKEYVMKRWGVFRSGSRNQSSNSASSDDTGERPNYQCAAFSTSRDSTQFNQPTQIMTMNQGSGTSPGHLAPDAEASSKASADRE